MIDEFITLPTADHDPGGKVKLVLPSDVVSEAIYSPCQQYRYTLQRHWTTDEPKNAIMFIMLNPSTATEDVDDPTVRKCRNYATRWGYNHLLVGNIMAYRATDPILLRDVDDPIGPDNLQHLRQMLQTKPKLICAWGQVNSRFSHAEQAVKSLISDLAVQPYTLRLTITGGPYHPLYLPMDIKPKLWSI